jgi:hypothetical protein
VIEDGAAIFERECEYAEGRYGEGWQCEATDRYRFEYDRLVTLEDHSIDLLTIEDWDQIDEKIREIVLAIEEAYAIDDYRVSIDVDPDPVSGQVTIDYLGYSLIYTP